MFDWQKHSDTIHTVVQGIENLHRQPTHRWVYFRLVRGLKIMEICIDHKRSVDYHRSEYEVLNGFNLSLWEA